jgi:hypothetical protein
MQPVYEWCFDERSFTKRTIEMQWYGSQTPPIHQKHSRTFFNKSNIRLNQLL